MVVPEYREPAASLGLHEELTPSGVNTVRGGRRRRRARTRLRRRRAFYWRLISSHSARRSDAHHQTGEEKKSREVTRSQASRSSDELRGAPLDGVVARNWFDKSNCPGVAMVEPTDAGKGDDSATARRFNGTRDGRVTIERHVRSVLVVVGDMRADQAEQMPLAKHDHVIEHSRRNVHTHLSAYPFCQGERGETRICRTPRLSTRASNSLPKMASRSRISRSGTMSAPIASTICCAVHAAYGCAVTLTCSTRRRSSERTKKT
jgi:hypothetical protein